MNILLANAVRDLAIENLRASGSQPGDENQVGKAILDALVQAGIDLRRGPTLEEMKSLLSEVSRLAHCDANPEHTAA
jgi:hypothetical protein